MARESEQHIASLSPETMRGALSSSMWPLGKFSW